MQTTDTRQKGKRAEQLAEAHLIKQKYKIINRNYHVGRLGELDLIIEDDRYIIFVEVKSSYYDNFGNPIHKITLRKQHQIAKMAAYYLAKFPQEKEARYDAVIVQFDKEKFEITHYKDAFRL